MSAAQRIAKLESLLERIEKNRRPAPGPIALGGAAGVPSEPGKPPRPVAMPRPEPEPPPALELVEPTIDVGEHAEAEIPRPPKPTPMEMALETIDQPEPSMEVEISIEEGPEITIDQEEELEEAIPTAPVETRAPVVERAPEPLAARAIELETAAQTAKVARVVSQPRPSEPTTFGELLDRTLSLRPR